MALLSGGLLQLFRAPVCLSLSALPLPLLLFVFLLEGGRAEVGSVGGALCELGLFCLPVVKSQ